MKRIFLLLTIALTFFAGMRAEEEPAKKTREEMFKEFMDFKMKFIAQEIDLEEGQQKRFMELYTEMSEEKGKLFEQIRKQQRKVRKDPQATDADYATLSRMMNEAKEKDAEIDKKYDEKFASFLSSKQIYKMKNAEEKFRKKMQEMRHKHKRKK